MKRRHDPPHTDDLYGPRYARRDTRRMRLTMLLLAAVFIIVILIQFGIVIGR